MKEAIITDGLGTDRRVEIECDELPMVIAIKGSGETYVRTGLASGVPYYTKDTFGWAVVKQ